MLELPIVRVIFSGGGNGYKYSPAKGSWLKNSNSAFTVTEGKKFSGQVMGTAALQLGKTWHLSLGTVGQAHVWGPPGTGHICQSVR